MDENNQTFNAYCLKPGLNVIKISRANTLELYIPNAGSSNATTTLLIKKLDIVSIKNSEANPDGINTALLGLDKLNLMGKEFLDYITALLGDNKNKFFYNCPIDNSVAISINESKETLLDPNIWYDTNNINNQFVIAELDAENFEDFITINRSSLL